MPMLENKNGYIQCIVTAQKILSVKIFLAKIQAEVHLW